MKNLKNSLKIWKGALLLFILSLLVGGQGGFVFSSIEEAPSSQCTLDAVPHNSKRNTPVESGKFAFECDEDENEDEKKEFLSSSKGDQGFPTCFTKDLNLGHSARKTQESQGYAFSSRVALFICYEDFRL